MCLVAQHTQSNDGSLLTILQNPCVVAATWLSWAMSQMSTILHNSNYTPQHILTMKWKLWTYGVEGQQTCQIELYQCFHHGCLLVNENSLRLSFTTVTHPGLVKPAEIRYSQALLTHCQTVMLCSHVADTQTKLHLEPCKHCALRAGPCVARGLWNGGTPMCLAILHQHSQPCEECCITSFSGAHTPALAMVATAIKISSHQIPQIATNEMLHWVPLDVAKVSSMFCAVIDRASYTW